MALGFFFLHSVNTIALALLLSAGVALAPGAAFAMGKEWMPCQNFDVYQKAVSKEK